ncbi:hypothetical protein K1719_037252 [Acacia pycnantha]|nr:hypothetical protein K1719_037252 [Acacia pycnantha]
MASQETEEEAATASDIAKIRLKGPTAAAKKLNFVWQSHGIESILKSTEIPIGKGASKLFQQRTADEILLHISNNNNPVEPPSTTVTSSSEQYHPNPNPGSAEEPNNVCCEIIAESVMSDEVIELPFEAENQRGANSEAFVMT